MSYIYVYSTFEVAEIFFIFLKSLERKRPVGWFRQCTRHVSDFASGPMWGIYTRSKKKSLPTSFVRYLIQAEHLYSMIGILP